MLSPREKYEQEVANYRKKLIEINEYIKEKQTEHSRERAKPEKLRNRKLSEITEEIRQLQKLTFQLKPKKLCPNCNTKISYNEILCWHCGEVFLDVCPKCGSIKIQTSEWGNIKCLECGLDYSSDALLKELLIGWADPDYPRLKLLDVHQLVGFNCYNIGIKRNTIWDICKEYDCPFEEKCEYYCPAFIALLGLIKRGKVPIGLPWGDYPGGNLHAYKIRWKRPKSNVQKI